MPTPPKVTPKAHTPRKTAPAPRAKAGPPQPKPNYLDEGDAVECSMTVEVKIGGSSAWVKVGATVHVRPGETAAEADERAGNFVLNSITEKAQELSNG